MANEALGQLDLARYLEVASRLLGQAATVLIVSDKRLVSHAGAEPPPVVDWLDAEAPGWDKQPSPQRYESHDSALVVFGLVDHGGSLIAHLLVLYPLADDQLGESIVSLLASLVECAQTEFRLSNELLMMAEELTVRYEELNLVYDTQDQASDYEETQDHLKSLVDNCLEGLGVSFSALILRERKLTLYSAQPELETSDVQLALDELQGPLYDWVAATKNVAVINGVKDKLASVLCAGVPYKIIATPILSGGSEVMGVLIVARAYSQSDFTNNDKNLLDVMSRKASKIVQASYDSQTGLVKRSGFEFQVGRALQAVKVMGLSNAVFVIDIDRMQVINDTLGFEAGDMVIVRLARVLEEVLRSGDTIARLGGDEFGVVVHNCELGQAKKIALKLIEAIEALELTWQGSSVETGVSIGVTPVVIEHKNVDAVVAAAEVACSSVKDRGGNGVSIYRSGDEELVRRKSYMDLVGRIQDTLRSDRFELYCQPIAPLQPGDGTVHGEVLLRMLDDEGGIISPGLFLPAAERYHLMPSIDRWVVGKAISMLDDSGVLAQQGGVIISINLSGQTLSDQSFVRFVHGVLDQSAVPAGNVCFEITETTAISSVSQAQQFIAAFKERGVLFSLDDFGTGLSTFSYLKQLPVDFLKIDGSFVKEICSDPVAKTMVEAINNVGHTMNLLTVGEFVENAEIMQVLAEIGVDYGQGYGIAKPKPFSEYLDDMAAVPQARNAG